MDKKNIRYTGAGLLFIVSLVLLLAGCYDNAEIEDFAYVTAIGIDRAEENNFYLTFQTALPQSIAEGEGEGSDMITFKTDNFLSGLKKTTHYLSRKINLSHTKVIVLSEDIAKEGITAFLNGLQDFQELRPDINIVVASEGAQKYIASVQSKLSSNPAKYYDLLFKSYENDFHVPYTQLEYFLYRVNSGSIQPVAIYTGINADIVEPAGPNDGEETKKEDEKKEEEGGNKKSGGDSGLNMEVKGIAVFSGDKMTGSLQQEEATLYALLTGSNIADIEVTDPLDKRFKVLSNIRKEKTLGTKVKIIDNKPYISINLKLNAEVKSVQSGNDYNEPDKAVLLQEAYKSYFNENITKLLKKVTMEYQSDIFGFGELAKKNYLTLDGWNQLQWGEIFAQAVYQVNIDFEMIKRD